jgi:hypothetical protein
MSIFNKNPRDNLNAILNWKMDNGLGHIDQYIDRQIASDFNHIGKAFLANSMISLIEIVNHNNYSNEADTLIFPILFSIWHSFELLLKSGILALDILGDPSSIGTHRPEIGHKINDLFSHFEVKLTTLGLVGCKQNYLNNIEIMLSDLDGKNARFDFGRYSYDLKLNPQFYNQTDTSKRITQNTYVNIQTLIESLLLIINDFVKLIDELNLRIEYLDNTSTITITDNDIDSGIQYTEKISEELDQILELDNNNFYEYVKKHLM